MRKSTKNGYFDCPRCEQNNHVDEDDTCRHCGFDLGPVKAEIVPFVDKKKTADVPGGRADGRPDSDFNPKSLAKGTEVEYEHSPKKSVAKDIAKDHLAERPDYYEKLERMERSPMIKVKTSGPVTWVKGKAYRGGRVIADEVRRGIRDEFSDIVRTHKKKIIAGGIALPTAATAGTYATARAGAKAGTQAAFKEQSKEKEAMVSGFFDELEKIAAAQKKDSKKKDLLVGGAVVGGSALAAPHVRQMVTGRTRLYHGTAPSNVPDIMEKGILPSAHTGQRGVTDILEESVAAPSRKMVFMAKKKGTAREFAAKGEGFKEFFKANPHATQQDVQYAHQAIMMDPNNVIAAVNPLNNKGVLTADVPMWRSDVAKTVRENPELRGGFRNFVRGVGDLAADATGLPAEQARWVAAPSAAIAYPQLKATKGFEGGISPEFIRGSKHFKRLTLREVGQYAKAKPGRFGTGLALGAAGLGAAAYGTKRIVKAVKSKEKKAEISQVELAKREKAMQNEQQLLKTLKPGDLVFSAPHRNRKGSFLGKRVFKPLSRKIQGTDFGHTAIYTGNGNIIDTRMERAAKEVPIHSLLAANNVVAARPNNATPEETQAAIQYARTHQGTPYSFSHLLRAATPFQGKFRAKDPAAHKQMCSELAANAYSRRKFAPVNRRYIRPSQILGSKQVTPVAYLETSPQPM